MQKLSLDALARQELKRAANASSGRSAETIYGGHEKVLRQTVIGMMKGVVLSEHQGPGEATVQVLAGRVRLAAGDSSWEGRVGTVLVVPDSRHSVEALEDSAILLTVARNA
jgi:quercetin dioxygenase-like cupin family protein